MYSSRKFTTSTSIYFAWNVFCEGRSKKERLDVYIAWRNSFFYIEATEGSFFLHILLFKPRVQPESTLEDLLYCLLPRIINIGITKKFNKEISRSSGKNTDCSNPFSTPDHKSSWMTTSFQKGPHKGVPPLQCVFPTSIKKTFLFFFFSLASL